MKRTSLMIFILLLWAPLMAQSGPRYQNYTPNVRVGWDAAEPSIGVNWNTGNVMFQAGLETLRVNFDDSTSPARTNWVLSGSLLTSLLSLDPIGFTNRGTNRSFVSQLNAGCSITAYSDDDGANWMPTVGCGIPAGLDHQTVGGGKYAVPPFIQLYPDAIYYCSQNLVSAFCSRSDNGGLLFGVGTPVYLITQCDGLHGHVKVGADGTVYLPNSSCGGKQAVAVSRNNGLTWSVRKVPTSSSGNSDPSVATGANNTLYLGYENGDGHPHVAVSVDRGLNWIRDKDVGAAAGIQNSVFPVMVAGDDTRAALAFLGTTTAGDYQNPNFSGVWHLYIVTTYDAGRSWSSVIDVTPNDPVQVGSINIREGIEPATRHFTTGLATPILDRADRNLLDFIEATVDKSGRLLVAYADGCVNECVSTPTSLLSRSAVATIARQSGGKRLFAAFDPIEPSTPGAPLLASTRDGSGIHLSWLPPDNGGAGIQKFKIYRGGTSGSETLFKTVGPSVTSLDDPSVIGGSTYYYRVSAGNKMGDGPQGNEVSN